VVSIKFGFASFIALLIGLTILSIAVLFSLNQTSAQLLSARLALQNLRGLNKGQTPSYSEDPTALEKAPEETNISANFEIYTNGTKRVFTSSMYHNLSADVYISAQDPSIVNVKKEKITWSDFFNTLPMSLSKDCLVTGTNQTFCIGENGVLRFYINGVENRNTLDLVIQNQDSLTVKFE